MNKNIFNVDRMVNLLRIMICSANRNNQSHSILKNSVAADELMIMETNELDEIRSRIDDSWCYNAHDGEIYLWKR